MTHSNKMNRRNDATAGWWIPIMSGITLAGAFAIGAQVLAILGSPWHPALELSNHFVMHGCVLGLLSTAGLWWRRRARSTYLVALSTLYLIWLAQPWTLYLTSPAVPTESQTERLRVLSWNLWAGNRRIDALSPMIHDLDPDVMLLIEVTPEMLDELAALEPDYPYQLVYPDWRGSGMALLSRVRGIRMRREGFGYPGQSAIVAEIDREPGQAPLSLVGMHALSPIPPHRAMFRDHQIEQLIEWGNTREGPICIVGDLNLTPWTAAFANLRQAGFVDSRVGVGNCPTWPASLGWLGIPIDHALARGDCTITNRRVLSQSGGSDHYPIAFDLRY